MSNHFSTSDPIKARQEILTSLDKEQNQSEWINVCDCIYRNIPALKEASGRLSNQDIKLSIIGQLGFDSFRSFIESPKEKQGLEWSMNKWNMYKKNYSYICKYPYLRELSLAVSEIQNRVLVFKRFNIDFPDTLEGYQEAIAELERAKEEKKSNTISELKKSLTEANNRLEQQKIAQLRDRDIYQEHHDQRFEEIKALQNKVNELTLKISELTNELSQKDIELAKREAELREFTKRRLQDEAKKKSESKQDNTPQKISWFEHLKGLFFLSKT
ncbi:hypothetical protein CF386_12625 (plasmid) [Paraphotobacterium marinum]|uniref:Uncharacterized protein n=1 Tax=Paraphotobacterium marinum TaxID=1755811 RepID=A0A220VHN3_9GAMM|nr:hypothetical protein [Paraphotobacterium marinum]ASK79894.1 hypothetical protein CF386_12625 [Paraphotobacterium marinum]